MCLNRFFFVIISLIDCKHKTMSCSQCAVAALLVALAVGVQGHQIIYVDTENGTLNTSCWEGGPDQPCATLELADTGAQRYNSTIAFLLRYGSSRNTPTIAHNTPQALSYPPLSTADTVSCRCNGLASNQNDLESTQFDHEPCPTWFEPSNGNCKCGKTIHDVVKCDKTLQEVAILDCYCMTHNESTGTVVGACFYNCVSNKDLQDVVYRPMPNTVENLTQYMCGDFNRTGQLCGECKTNYTPPVYSYDLQCITCSDDQYNWLKYVAIAFAPLTIFLVLVLCCRISATSPQLNAFVTVSQTIAIPANVRVLLVAIYNNSSPGASIAVRILTTVYGVWNLDFFRTLVPHAVCLKVDTLQALALDYSIAFYPLVLIVVAYVLIELHVYNFRLIVWIWRPFHRCFARFRQQWDIKTSIIDAFATFLLLSNIKLLSVSFDLLIPTSVYNINGTVVGIYLYYDASIEYFGTSKHLPYAILAVFVVLTFVFFPILLLLLYPMKCFRRCLDRCKVRSHALHIFVDTFQGCYKDGTNGTRDCRYFAAVYLILRFTLFILFAVTLSAVFYAVAILALIGIAMLLVIVQPYKAEFSSYNVVDSVLILTLAMWCGSAVFFNMAATKAHRLLNTSLIVSFLLAVLLLLYLVVIFLHWICSRKRNKRRLVQSIIGRICWQKQAAGLGESLPDRLVNPYRYISEEENHATYYGAIGTKDISVNLV